jgi:predicted amidophosphoribosyltransferase
VPTGILATLLDLVLPGGCAGCGAATADRTGICVSCAAALAQPPEPRRPRPAPPGLPACVAGGDYDGSLRELILAYKERGRRSLARPLGDRLAEVVAAGWPEPGPLALVPVPATAAAMRARYGDHMLRLARQAARALSASGRPAVVASPLRALPRADSSHLDREQRAAAAREGFAVRWRSGVRLAALASVGDSGAVVLVDDILTTGATLGAVAGQLLRVGVPVTFAATLAATRRHGRETDGSRRDLGQLFANNG